MTVGELRDALAGVPRDLDVVLCNDLLGDYTPVVDAKMVEIYAGTSGFVDVVMVSA